ncbi:MAG: hypothetical protein COB08_014655 [Rhodobacteraceae bacterium]|nr:hypothetical protein [Paracoccaceae bacterium]
MPSALYQPKVSMSLLGFIGQLLCIITGILLLGLPFKYWQIFAANSGVGLGNFTVPMQVLLGVHLVLLVIFLIPAMARKYLRSSDRFAQKVWARMLALIALLLLGLDALLFLFRKEVELPGILADVTSQQWIMALTMWLGPYLGFLVLPAAYLRELNVQYEAQKLRLPIRTGVKVLAGKGYFFPIGREAAQNISAFSAQTGLPVMPAQKNSFPDIGMLLLSLPILPVFLGLVVAMRRGNFLPNERLLTLSSDWMMYFAGYLFLLLAARAVLNKSTKAIILALLGPPLMAFAIWPFSTLHGMPLLHAYFFEQGAEIKQQYTVLPQPDRLTGIFASHCISPLLVSDAQGAEVYLCGIKIGSKAGIRPGAIIGLRGTQTNYGFYHERKITLIEG